MYILSCFSVSPEIIITVSWTKQSINQSINQSTPTDTARERPRLNLQPRSKPAEKVEKAEKPKPSSEVSRQTSIFGSAKPVDTASKEREIEEKMKKLDTTAHFTSEEKDSYGSKDSYSSKDK